MSNLKLKFKIQSFNFGLEEIVVWFLLILSFLITRLVNLTIIPVFVDEAIYIRWAQVMRAENTLRFLPLSDGKQPLFMWLIIPFLKIFRDPLVAGRIVSVLSGLGTMAGMFVLSYFLFESTCFAALASIFYLVSPFAFFFDRMALADGLLSFLGVWFLIFAVWLAKKTRLDLAMIAGILLGLGLITKSPAIFFAFLLPITVLFSDFKKKAWVTKLGKLVILWGVIYLFGLAIYNILRLGPEFQMIALRNRDYIFPITEVFKHPLNPFWENFKSIINWFWIFGTPPVFLLGLLGILGMLGKEFKKGIFLLICFLLPLLAQSAVAKVFTARYVLFSLPIFLIFVTYALETILGAKIKWLAIIFSLAIFIFPIYEIYLLLSDPAKAWLPQNERNGYLEMWTAGYGIKEASIYLRKVAEKQKVLVGTEGYFGTLPDGLQIYLEKVPNITIIGVGYPIKEIPEKLVNGLIDNRVFLLVNDSRFEVKKTDRLKLVTQYPKAENLKIGQRENLLFFEVLR